MTLQSATVRTMLRTYGKQLTSAKRLARFRQALGTAPPMDDVARQARRRELVEKIAHEVIENLIVNSTNTPVVTAILEQLEREFGQRYLFEYPVDGTDVQILRETQSGPNTVSGSERNRVMRRLWEITLSKVDDTML
ncbi:DVU0524 family FlgM-associated protein [Pseudodesulfovibrio sp.]|uniref:DVU0524 family FlgM-associated protein n=1 Tax=unclassified Pseudodesulfovibrio TaxID=2661612 RepID=UPI003B002B37